MLLHDLQDVEHFRLQQHGNAATLLHHPPSLLSAFGSSLTRRPINRDNEALVIVRQVQGLPMPCDQGRVSIAPMALYYLAHYSLSTFVLR